MFYPSRVTQFVINGSRGDGKDSYSLRVSFRPQPEPTPDTILWLAKQQDPGTGGYFAKHRPATLSKAARSDESSERLWQISERLVST
ncbi:Short-chain dehydrogenase [Novosphingobium lubricantis]|jgi:hypothetical protein|nr:hypothetical protein [Sphingobium sp. CECT 9361]CAH0356857.1 hypothetical protein SPH9361_04503 [Sphingobium sp. CECT 9361]